MHPEQWLSGFNSGRPITTRELQRDLISGSMERRSCWLHTLTRLRSRAFCGVSVTRVWGGGGVGVGQNSRGFGVM